MVRHTRKNRRSRRMKRMRGGRTDEVPNVDASSPDASSPDASSIPPEVDAAMGQAGGRRRRGKPSGGKDRRGNGGRHSKGGFVQNVALAVREAMVPLMLYYGVIKTKKNRSKKGGDDVA